MKSLLENNITYKFYKIYRRIRFIRYKKKLLRKEKLHIQAQEPVVQKKTRKPASFKSKIYRINRILRFLYRRLKKKRKENREKQFLLRQQQKAEQQEIKSKIRKKILTDEDLDAAKLKELKVEKKFKRKKRLRLIRFYFSRQRFYFLRALKSPQRYIFGIFIRRFRILAENRQERRKFLIITTNSTVYFIFSYLFIYLISNIILVLYSLQFKYRIIVFYHKIFYNITNEEWTPDAVKILYSAGPIAFLIAGLIFLIIYSKLRQDVKNSKLFFLWGFIHGLGGFFSPLLLGSLLNKGFGYVITYLYYKDTARMIFSIVSLFLLITIGVMSTRSFLISGNQYYNFIDKTNRRFFIFSQVVIPFFIGTFFIMLFRYPNSLFYGSMEQFYFELFIMLTNILIIIPILLTYRSFPELYFEEDVKTIKPNWKVLIIMVIFYLSFRFGLSAGIRLG